MFMGHAQHVASGIPTTTSASVSVPASPMLSSNPVGCRFWTEVRPVPLVSSRPVNGLTQQTGRWTPERSQHPTSFINRTRLGDTIHITVYFSQSDRQGLAIAVAKYTDGNIGIFPSSPFYEAEILKWVESTSRDTSCGEFQCDLEAFLYLYSQGNCVEKVDFIASLSLLIVSKTLG